MIGVAADILLYLYFSKIVPERKPGFFVKIKEGENFNRRHTQSILSIKFEPDTVIGEKTVFVQTLK